MTLFRKFQSKAYFLMAVLIIGVSCSTVPSSSTGFAEPPEEEQDFITYFEKNQKKLAPIEGVYFIEVNDTIHEKNDFDIIGIRHQSFLGYIFKSCRTDEIPNLYEIVTYQNSRLKLTGKEPVFLPHAFSRPVGSEFFYVKPYSNPEFNTFSTTIFINSQSYIDFYVNLFIETHQTITVESLNFHKIFPL